MKTLLPVIFAALALSLVGCKSSGDKASGDKAGESDTASPGLEMSSDSATCKKAMKCCELMVKSKKGKVTPEDLNLSCSGVAMASTDADCEEFRKGYLAGFESSGGEAPAECK